MMDQAITVLACNAGSSVIFHFRTEEQISFKQLIAVFLRYLYLGQWELAAACHSEICRQVKVLQLQEDDLIHTLLYNAVEYPCRAPCSKFIQESNIESGHLTSLPHVSDQHIHNCIRFVYFHFS